MSHSGNTDARWANARMCLLVRSVEIDPDRIVIGQVAGDHNAADILIEAGLWERTVQEFYRGGLHWRYRVTELGMQYAKAAKAATEVSGATEPKL